MSEMRSLAVESSVELSQHKCFRQSTTVARPFDYSQPCIASVISWRCTDRRLSISAARARMKTNQAFLVLKESSESTAVAPVTEHPEGLAREKVRIQER